MHETEMMPAIEWLYVAGSTPLEIVATVCAVIGVVLIARQNILGWPLGIVWAAISAYLALFEWSLVSDGILYLTYIPIQLYCWMVWIKRGKAVEDGRFLPTWMPVKAQMILAGSAVVAVGLWVVGVSALARKVEWVPEPDLLIRDSTTTVLNYFAQFLQARKRMENWVGWLIVNVLGIHIYWVKEAPIYSVQYAFFLGLGVYGWITWERSRSSSSLEARAAR